MPTDPSTSSGRAGSGGKRRYVRFTRWRRRRFFALLGESGNVRMAAELAGVGLGCIYRLRRVEPGFTERMAEAREKASLRLKEAGVEGAPPPRCTRSPSPANAGEDLVIRRGVKGRLRVMAPSNRWWQPRHDAVFLGHLAATGNITASARAAGFTKKTAYNQRDARPDFAKAWDETLAIAADYLENRAFAHVYRRMGGVEEAAFEAAHATPLDVDVAISLARRWAKRTQAARREGR
jgi:hypothetical protein